MCAVLCVVDRLQHSAKGHTPKTLTAAVALAAQKASGSPLVVQPASSVERSGQMGDGRGTGEPLGGTTAQNLATHMLVAGSPPLPLPLPLQPPRQQFQQAAHAAQPPIPASGIGTSTPGGTPGMGAVANVGGRGGGMGEGAGVSGSGSGSGSVGSPPVGQIIGAPGSYSSNQDEDLPIGAAHELEDRDVRPWGFPRNRNVISVIFPHAALPSQPSTVLCT